ncbi:type II toxin-antitoxin system prevent-host-death family antitoxin [Duganella sp. FT80W]|uniref:Type II toxin-antitoxin system prevent-host-death family antitoxin n=1 Tax=Duganella guangzhouensis TaxID=2666084 RepID=A0A6I2L1T7_9BURK|nr:type II toxin-antitoxin system prevent-host-death family antitoxin [Duganella guangzhouensis]MRW90239.1 type II toxin-antitoxin system prevent-host-death family antitoxin [Duganella guangzhouensis]
MPTVDITLAQTQLASLLEAASRGEEVVITLDGRTAVKLVPVQVRRVLKFGTMKGKIRIPEDFDAPLQEDIQAAFEGK